MSANADRVLLLRNLHGSVPRSEAEVHPPVKRRSSRSRLLCGAFCLALSASVTAQTHFCIGGDVDHLNAAEIAACKTKVSELREAVKQHGAPADWHFVVVCDETGWQEYASFARDTPGLLTDAGYSTDPRLRWTFVRGSKLTGGQAQATTNLLAMALDGLPGEKPAPEPMRPATARPYGVASAKPVPPQGTSSTHHHG